jgi:hypothetical protein
LLVNAAAQPSAAGEAVACFDHAVGQQTLALGHPEGRQSQSGPPAHEVAQVSHGSYVGWQVTGPPEHTSVAAPPRTVPPGFTPSAVMNDSTPSESTSSRSFFIDSLLMRERDVPDREKAT